MDIKEFTSFKDNPNIGEFDPLIIQKINSMFLTSNKNNRKNNLKSFDKSTSNQIKNQKFKDLKNKTETKINFILNKITNSNQDDILVEFCENISIKTEKEFHNVTFLFWKKMILHAGFSDIYFTFFRKIILIYSKVLDFDVNLKYFIDIIETKFLIDYQDITSELEKKIKNEIKIPTDLTEEEYQTYQNNYKYNNINIIILLLKFNIVDESMKGLIKEILYSNLKYSYDIYKWYLDNILEEDKKEITNYLESNNLPLRDKYLLEDLINKDNDKINEYTVIEQDTTDSSIEVNNLLEEYFFIKEVKEIELYVLQECNSALLKNNFSKYILDFYFSNKEEYCDNIINLFKYLLNKKILYKSNLSRGLLFLYKEWDNYKFDYPNHESRMIRFLKFLKNEGITRGIEFIIKNYV